MAWFHCNSVFYIGLKHFYVSLMDCFEKINVFLVNNVIQVSVIANNMFFLKN